MIFSSHTLITRLRSRFSCCSCCAAHPVSWSSSNAEDARGLFAIVSVLSLALAARKTLCYHYTPVPQLHTPHTLWSGNLPGAAREGRQAVFPLANRKGVHGGLLVNRLMMVTTVTGFPPLSTFNRDLFHHPS